MTRATLLHLLAHPATLAGPDVRALEELAQAFPYCQTAHLLLAKAAHDQGSMLAAQRLRRAATYAADRGCLRELIEAPALVVEAVLAEEAAVAGLATTSGGDLPPALPATSTEVYSNALAEEVSEFDLQDLTPTEHELTHSLEQAEPVKDEVLNTPLVEAELPPQAPPIRPPAEAAAARLEFGLADEEPAEIIAYRLPELDEPVPAADGASQSLTPRLPAFGGVADVGYAPSEGSRLGFGLVATDAAELMLPSASLPPANEFFAPDALLLAHMAAEQAPTLAKPSSLDLINSFLQRAPVASRRRAMPTPAMPDTEAQADLSVRSTRAEPDLASENLARILARQGKNERAIAVYERLMVKHPEKMAYFAAQIESLRPLA